MNKELSVLMMASSGGIGLTYHLTNLSIELKKLGCDISVVSGKREQIFGLKDKLGRAGIHHYMISNFDSGNPFFILKISNEIRTILRSKDVNIIHCNGISQTLKSYIAIRFIKKGKKRPLLILTLHSSDSYSSLVKRQFLRLATILASSAIPLSNSSRNSLISMGVPEEKLKIIPNGINLKEFDSLVHDNCGKLELPNKCDYKFVAYIAMLRPLKGHYYYLKAAHKVIQQFPKTKFLIIGEGELKHNLLDMACELGIEDNVVFTGLISNKDMPSLLYQIDIGVSSSLAEQFPHSILELMAARKPIVATSVGGVPDMIKNGENGFLVAPEDYEGLAEFILILLKNPDRAKEMGINGRKLIEREFDLKVVAKRHQILYNSIYK
jgi:glycosyltransferase involved in cell wall biosynthesis